MGTATSILLNEHKFLGKMLDFTEDMEDRIRQGEDIRAETLGRVAEFFRVCLEGCLITKEEDFLFTKLQSRGFPRQSGVIASMLIDHQRGRRLISEMAKAAAEYEAGNSGAGDLWAAAALDFVNLMRAHLREEEESLFMFADSFLQPPEQAELAEEFKGLEEAQAISGRHLLIHQMPEGLPEQTEEQAEGTIAR